MNTQTEKKKVATPEGIIGIFYCSKCGNSFERTLAPTVHKNKSGTVTFEIVFYNEEVFCNDCHKKMFEEEQKVLAEAEASLTN